MFDLNMSEERIRKDAVRSFIIYNLEGNRGKSIKELGDCPCPIKLETRVV
jgi:hypothetical protein